MPKCYPMLTRADWSWRARDMGNLAWCVGKSRRKVAETASTQYAVMEMSGNECGGRTPRIGVSRRLLSGELTASPTMFGGIGPGGGSGAHWPPSRRREEARALQNLQRRVEACRSLKASNNETAVVAQATTSRRAGVPVLDNRPQLLQKVSNQSLVLKP